VSPRWGDAYFQEFAPGVAFDFAIVQELDASVVTPAGSFEGVLVTAEGNYFDGPRLAENKLFAPKIGLVMIQELDDEGRPVFEIPLQAIDPVTCIADLDHDGLVSASDLAALLGAWSEDDVFADLNSDGTVDGGDLGALLAAWGTCK
jgi:hypothetical protein